MINPTSVLADLLQVLPQLRPQIYFKSSLTALSHAMEDQVLAGLDQPLVIASFQRERFYRQEAHRYHRIAERTSQVYVLAAPETNFANGWEGYETVAFEPADGLSQEWHLVVIGPSYASCLICRERPAPSSTDSEMDSVRRFEGIWTFEREVTCKAAQLLLDRISEYRPELAAKIQEAKTQFLVELPSGFHDVDPDPFVQRLVTYIQANQYKLLKAYRAIAAQEQKERLVNSISTAIRRSLNTDEILQVAVEELGQALQACRCLIYCCKATDGAATINHEYLGAPVTSVEGQTWPLKDNILFQEVVQKHERVYVPDTHTDERLSREVKKIPLARQGTRAKGKSEEARKESLRAPNSSVQALVQKFSIATWVLVPVLYQDRLLGMVELHHCSPTQNDWEEDQLELVEAIATQLGAALIQAEAYANLQDLNQQLEALDRTRSNLVAITGHELRTPLSTIQVCLESLASEPDMPQELRQVMLNSALTDAERMRKLVQDFLTLSRLESGRVEWHPEALALQECVDLALSSIRARQSEIPLPQITTQVPNELPLVKADGEWLVEVLAKLLDNACKFTNSGGTITVEAKSNGGKMLEVTVADTGRGIESNRLEAVFDRFYQEEGSLRRTVGGTGLGLAICRQIVAGWGGAIWAESGGKDRGSQFHFTLPIVSSSPEPKR
ncbi:GAF domain-containing protein [Microcoleus sp. FACHB-831]|uniref:DICT sensory domain-containing protein n=1 Tax=Microcoleus sp. FACHB-831 TaxID=2692827 RepID=UPI001685E00E|nr:DICT sensory domain-containing protein [Microcoleus sp. FACHB-831]MBD1922073.1 GAF domain-containing protein [Microcoleus sp. FACHB-831]